MRKYKKNKKDKEVKGLQVKVYNNNVEKALRKFKRMVKDSEILFEHKKHTFYEKPSEKKRRKISLAKSRAKYQQLKDKEKNNY